MTLWFIRSTALAFTGALACTACLAQSPAASSTQSPSPAPDPAASAPAEAKRARKVWTNDDVNGLNGPVSVVGESKSPGKTGSVAKADPQYIASTRKELAKLQSQLEDTDKQLVDLKDFLAGKAAATSSGYQINKGYNREPVDQQITGLEDKKKQLQNKIGALLDEARKKGVQPGELR